MARAAKLSKKHQARIEKYIGEIQDALSFGDMPKALRIIEQSFERYPQVKQIQLLAAEVYHHAGQLEKSRDILQSYCKTHPKDADRHITLGTILEQLGDNDRAIEAFEQVIRIDPDNLEYQIEFSNTLIRYQQFERAVSYIQTLLAPYSDNAAIHNLLGTAYLGINQYPMAINEFKKALALDDQDPIYHNNIALTYAHRHQSEQSLEHYLRALQLTGETPQQLYNYAMALIECGQFDDTLNILKEKQPHFKGDNYSLYLDALTALARLIPVNDEVFQLLEQINTKARYDYNIESSINFAKARYFEKQQDFDQAFNYFKTANNLLAKHHAFDRQQHEDKLSQLKKIFTDEFIQQCQPVNLPPSELKPVFIIGMPRSGTTLLQRRIGEIIAIDFAAETEGMHLAWCALQEDLENLKLEDTLAKARETYINHIRLFTDGNDIIDKMPGNFMYLPLITLLFPDALIIHSVRNPLDTCVSCYTTQLGKGHAYSYQLQDLGSYYRSYIDLMSHWKSLLPNRFHKVHYEEHVSKPEDTKTLLGKWLSFKKQEENTDNPHSAVIETMSAWQARQPIHTGSVNRYEIYEQQLKPLMEALEPVAV